MTQTVVRAGTDLAVWADEARAVHAIAVSLASTSFAPKTMQGRPDEICGAILAGRELGLSPMASLRAIDIIDGTPALRAVALRGLVQAHGHRIWVEESTQTRAVVMGQRAGDPAVQKSLWTMDRAQRAGLAAKRNWQSNPQAMLIARATAECARLVASDVVIALPYIAEEIGDEDPGAAGTKPARKRTAQRRALAELPPAPELPTVAPHATRGSVVGAEPGPSPDTYTPAPVSAKTLLALQVAYRDLGITDRAERLAHASVYVGRDLVSANDLTDDEAGALVAELTARLEQERAERGGEADWPDVGPAGYEGEQE